MGLLFTVVAKFILLCIDVFTVLLAVREVLYTVACNQIANKSFVLLNTSIFGEYRKKPPLRSASHARRQDSMTGGGGGGGGGNKNKIFRGGTKSLIFRIRECGPKKKVFISKYARIFTNSGVNTKKSSSSQKMREFSQIPRRNHKKEGLYYKICKKQFLLTNSGVITSILGVLGLELHFSDTDSITFFPAQFSLGGTILVWGAQAVIWETRPRNAPRGVGPAAKLQQFIEQ